MLSPVGNFLNFVDKTSNNNNGQTIGRRHAVLSYDTEHPTTQARIIVIVVTPLYREYDTYGEVLMTEFTNRYYTDFERFNAF